MDLSINVGGTYYMASYRVGFGSYWMIVKILEIKEKPCRYNNKFKEYSIKYKKIKSHYDEKYATYGVSVKEDVWCHGERKETIKYRFLEV